jgi:chromosome segregation protein
LASQQSQEARRTAKSSADGAGEEARRAEWLVKTRRDAPQAGPVAVRRAELAAELAAEERIAARLVSEREGESARLAQLAERLRRDRQLTPIVRGLVSAIENASGIVDEIRTSLDEELARDGAQGDGVAQRLRSLAGSEAELQSALAKAGEAVTVAEVDLQRLRDRSQESELLVNELALALGLDNGPCEEALEESEREATIARIDRLAKRREQLGPVNPLAQDEYKEALEHVEELESQRSDLESALAELRGLIRDCDRTIKENFEQTFEAASKHFEELAGQLFPGGKGRLRLVTEETSPSRVLGGAQEDGEAEAEAEADEDEIEAALEGDTAHYGVEIEITPAGKSMKRLTLLSGGEKSMTALAFLFAVFLARPCPFYILDEVEAALDDLNLGRFIELLRTYRNRSQFIVVTHQRRTMEAADALYGVSMGGDGISKVVSRKLEADAESKPKLAA